MCVKIHECRLEEFEGHCGLCILINNINFNFAFTPQWKSKCQNLHETSNNFCSTKYTTHLPICGPGIFALCTLRWLFGSYQSCNNLSTHSIHENFFEVSQLLDFPWGLVFVLHIPRKSKYCRRMKTVDPTLLLHEQTFINPVTSLCSKIHRNESLLKSMCYLFGWEIKELLKSQQIGHETSQKKITF